MICYDCGEGWNVEKCFVIASHQVCPNCLLVDPARYELKGLALQLSDDLWLDHLFKFHFRFLMDMLLAEADECLMNQAISLGRRMIGGDIKRRDQFYVMCRAAWDVQQRSKP